MHQKACEKNPDRTRPTGKKKPTKPRGKGPPGSIPKPKARPKGCETTEEKLKPSRARYQCGNCGHVTEMGWMGSTIICPKCKAKADMVTSWDYRGKEATP
jgi:hypothetical protein